MNRRLKRVKDEIFRYRLISCLCIVTTITSMIWYQVKLQKMRDVYVDTLESQMEQSENVADVINTLRKYEYDLNLLNAGIESKQLTIEQNIDTAYRILQAKSSRTTDDELMRVINERVITLRDTMTTADLFQAIAVMKENFPAATYEELDALYEKNVTLMGQITRSKENNNRMINEYESIIRSNAEALQMVNFTKYDFKVYTLHTDGVVDEEETKETENPTEPETEPEESTVYVEPMAVG